PRRVLSTGHRLPEGFRLGDDEARPFAVDGQLDAFQASGQPKLGDRPPSLPPVGRAEDEVVTVDDGFHRPAAGASFQGGTEGRHLFCVIGWPSGSLKSWAWAQDPMSGEHRWPGSSSPVRIHTRSACETVV